MAGQLTILLATVGFLASLVSGRTYYIIPDHTPCPTETTPTGSESLPVTPSDHTPYNEDTTYCLTLTQCAQLLFPATAIDSNINLIFEPGHHTLGSSLQIQNVNKLVLRVAPTNSSSISVAMVTCTNSSGIDFETISEVTVSGLEFSRCQENSVRWVDQLKMENCGFKDGHGIELMNVRSATFERSSFISLTAFRKIWETRYRRYQLSGGAIAAFSSDINVTECLFEGNSAAYDQLGDGGAIWTDGGSISVHSSQFSSNRANKWGGAIWSYSANISIQNSDFSSNTAGYGGTILTVSGTITINGSRFSNNIVGIDGGAIVTDSANINIHDSGFSSNSATYGGAIWTISGSINVYKSDFRKNTASHGGAIRTDSGSIRIYDSNFSSNRAGDDGGAIRTKNGRISIHGSNFSNNRADGWGGAIGTDSSIRIHNSDFTSNTASYGGAIGTYRCSIVIKDSSFSNNSVRIDGGAIRTESGSIRIHGSDFSSNRAGDDGGAIRTVGSRISIHGSSFSNNRAKDWGGAIGTDKGSIWIHNSDFTSNKASYGGAIGTNRCSMTINGTNFSNNSVRIDGGAITTDSESITIQSSGFHSNRAGDDGGAIRTVGSRIDIHESNFSSNGAKDWGGAIRTDESSMIIHGSNFTSNKASYSGAIETNRCSIVINGSNFSNNSVTINGGAITTDSGSISIHGSYFSSNTAHGDGGAIWTDSGSIHIHASDFSSNTANGWGGAIRTDSGSVSIHGSDFSVNTASYGGGAIGSWSGNIGINYSVFFRNRAVSLGGAIRTDSGNISLHVGNFSSNTASSGGVLRTESGSISIRGSVFMRNTAVKDGGVLFLGNATSSVNEINSSIFNHNHAANKGGAIYVQSRIIRIGGLLQITNNSALSGGGLYANHSELIFEGRNMIISENVATTKGGGICAVGSTIKLTGGQTEFIDNRAKKGGGIQFELDAKLHLIKSVPECSSVHHNPHSICIKQSMSTLRLYFTNNSANYGGAMYISDDTSGSSECFFQDLASHSANYSDLIVQNTFFANNSASISGASIFGGLLGRCTVSPSAQVLNKYQNIEINATSYLQQITNLRTNAILQSEVSSEPVHVCLCTNNQIDCDRPSKTYTFQRTSQLSKSFNVSAVVVDQVRNPVPSSVRASSSYPIGLVEGQEIQNTASNCTDLNFTISFPRDSGNLILVVNHEHQQLDFGINITILFVPCTCPIGFIRHQTQYTCICECDPCLSSYITDCLVSNSSVKRTNNAWISYTNEPYPDHQGYQNESQCPYLTYPHCPFDYCHPSSSAVWINLNTSNGSDAQCAFDRSGKLCGSCKDGLSLSLGSSRCLSCSNHWLGLLMVFAIAGVALVAFLLVCNLTVAVGTINGLIFYANILTTNRTTFFPFQSPNFFTISISWLNLDFGFVTCFFDGMDGYVKEWLQLAFPIYIIFMVTMVIIGCEYSTRIARLFTGTNPVATLATLILLSYAKSLRVIIAAFSSATLEYPDGSQEIVWLIDANVLFLRGKHIPLFLVAVLILLMGIAYTSLLFFYQWLLRCPNRMVKQIKNARFYPFMDAYLAPYNIKHRYWTGLLLLIRAFLYILAAFNVSEDPGNNLLSIICILVSLLILKILLTKRIYKLWTLDALETSYIFNLVLFSVGSLYIRGSSAENQESLAYTSTCIAFITFLAILTYHTYAFVLSKKIRTKLDSFIHKMKLQLDKQKPADHEIILVPHPVVTYSVVDPVPTQQQLLEKEATAKHEREATIILKNEPATNMEPYLVSQLNEQTLGENNFQSRQINVSAMALFEKDKIEQQKGTVNIKLEPRPSTFSDVCLDPYTRDSDALGMERETEINNFIDIEATN